MNTTLHAFRSRRQQIIIALSIVLIFVLFMAMAVGPTKVPFLAFFTGDEIDVFSLTVFTEIRLPRTILALFVGATLALSGAVLQALFRNPLADPSLIGVSSGAALGAISFIVLGAYLPDSFENFKHYLLPVSAIMGALVTTIFLYAFAHRYGHFSIVTMLLVGIAINAIATVGIGAFQYLSEESQLRILVFWMMGSFGRGSWITVIPAIIIMFTASFFLLVKAKQFDLLQFGESEARYLGVDVDRLKRQTILLTAIVIGAGVALTGIIGFIGLIVPHLVRLLGGASHRYVLTGSALLGGALALIADVIARTIIAPAEIPVGLVTSAIGAPFFLWLITRVKP